MIYRQRDSAAVSAWIADKRGAYTHGGEVHCPGFHLYRGFVGCPAWAAGKRCTYCFLQTTFRTDPELRSGVAWVDACSDTRAAAAAGWPPEGCERPCTECEELHIDNARAAVTKWLARSCSHSCPVSDKGCERNKSYCKLRPRYDGVRVLNPGELGDSFGFTPEANPHIGMLLDLFSDPQSNPYGHKVLFLSKAGPEPTREHLRNREPSEDVILSWSVGNLDDRCEPYWAGSPDRALAADAAAADGWTVRLRIDPLDWTGDCVADFTDGLCQTGARRASLITLGTLRHRGGRVKLPAEERAEIYRGAIEGLRNGGYEGPIGLCKETPPMIRDVLGIEPEQMRCNCLP